jgi:hypothetical protein
VLRRLAEQRQDDRRELEGIGRLGDVHLEAGRERPLAILTPAVRRTSPPEAGRRWQVAVQ